MMERCKLRVFYQVIFGLDHYGEETIAIFNRRSHALRLKRKMKRYPDIYVGDSHIIVEKIIVGEIPLWVEYEFEKEV